MMRVTINREAEALEWAASRVGSIASAERGGATWAADSQALAVIDEADQIRAVAVMNYFQASQCVCHIASDGTKAWVNAHTLSQLFTYPFCVLNLRRLSGYTPAANQTAYQFALRLGFIHEGVQRRAAPDGDDLLVTGMLREECRWLREGIHGR